RIEGHQARRVDHAGELAGQPLELLFGEPQHRIGDVARQRDALFPQERVESVAEAFAQRVERWSRHHFPEKPVVRRSARARPHQDVDLADPGIAVEQHRQRHLAEETGDAGDEDLAPAKSLAEIDRLLQGLHDQGFSLAAATPGLAAEPPPCSGSILVPSAAVSATSVITSGGWCMSVMLALRPCRPRARSMASASVSARSQPSSCGTWVFSVPTAM